MLRLTSAGFATALVILSSSGCASVKLATLQGDYYDLMETQTLCETGAGTKGVRPIPKPPSWMQAGADLDALPADCDVSGDLRGLAVEAEKAAADGDLRTRIAYLRLAGVAAWQAGALDRTIELGLKGQQLCQTIGPDEFGAPRDCAILSGVGALAQADLASQKIDDIEELVEDDPERWKQEAAAVRTNLESSDRNLRRARAHIAGLEGVDESVTVYFDRQHRLLQCNYANLASEAFALRDAALTTVFSKGVCEMRDGATAPDACFPGDSSVHVPCP